MISTAHALSLFRSLLCQKKNVKLNPKHHLGILAVKSCLILTVLKAHRHIRKKEMCFSPPNDQTNTQLSCTTFTCCTFQRGAKRWTITKRKFEPLGFYFHFIIQQEETWIRPSLVLNKRWTLRYHLSSFLYLLQPIFHVKYWLIPSKCGWCVINLRPLIGDKKRAQKRSHNAIQWFKLQPKQTLTSSCF